MDDEQELISDVCDEEGGMIITVTKVYEVGGEMLVIKNVPMISCNNGEDYFTAQTMMEIERIKMHGDAIAERRSVLVADFAPPVEAERVLEPATA